jgi:DNA-directed RNA polymerase subunit RPC12/RpoP
MKINYKAGRINVELEGDTQKDLFSQLSSFQEVFDEDTCGKCGGQNIRFVVRDVDENSYYEIRCKDCGGRLEFGQVKKGGGLFPRRKDKEGSWLPDNGWVKWNPKTKTVE